MKRINILLLLITIGVLSAFAGTNWGYIDKIKPTTATVEYEPSNGRFKITFNYYFNPTNSAKDCSLTGDSYINAAIDGIGSITIMKLKGCSDCEYVNYSDCANSSDNGYIKVGSSFVTSGKFSESVSDGNAASATFYYYPPARALGKAVSFYFYFKIEQDQDGESAVTETATKTGATLPDIAASDFSVSSAFDQAKDQIKVTASCSKYQIPQNLYWKGVNNKSVEITSSNTSQLVTRSDNGVNLTNSFELRFSEKVTKTVTVNHTISGYQKIQNFSATYTSDGKVNLSWNFSGGSGTCISDQFVIERANNIHFSNAEQIGLNMSATPTTKNYSFTDDLVQKGVYYSPIYYRITRSTTNTPSLPNWGWNFGQMVTITPNFQHVSVTSASASLVEVNNDDAIKIQWTINDDSYLWSTGSRFVIVRENSTTGTSNELTGLSTTVMKSGEYYDYAIQQCNTYIYKVYVQPGNEQDFNTNVYVTTGITPTKQGSLVWADASKGYYSDRIELDWETTGTYDQFSIFRRVHNGTDTTFNALKTIDGASVLTHYREYDDMAEAGTVYDYKIIGLLKCSEDLIESNAVYATGFRTPTGDVYGRVTYEGGQAEDSVEVYLSSSMNSYGYSLLFDNSNDAAYVDDFKALDGASEFTLQAYVFNNNSNGNIISKSGMYELGINTSGTLYFKVGNVTLNTTTSYANTSTFFHVTAVKEASRLAIYVDGVLADELNVSASMTTNTNRLNIGGGNFRGNIDEVRIWKRALADNEIAKDYSRYIVGNEDNLVAYYSFNYIVDNEFYDVSHTKDFNFNKNHGEMSNVTLSTNIPTNAQLGYRSYTDNDGSYSIHGVPYFGGGTLYTIIPKRGIHQFTPQREDRYISAGAQNHTVNFTDISSFEVSGTVTYEGGTYPVQGAYFEIDGVVVLDDKNNRILTDANGEFTIKVPVGTHEVKVKKDGHTFLYDGRICDRNLADLNYQDRVPNRELTDITKVKYIGRVAGGVIQEGYPVGFGLSKNNLADNITVTLTHQRTGYYMNSNQTTVVYKHELDGCEAEVDSNAVVYDKDKATIKVNNNTGEFVAYLIPEKFIVTVNAPGQSNIPGNNTELNLTSVFKDQFEKYEYSDSVIVTKLDTTYQTTIYGNDTAVTPFVIASQSTVYLDKKDSVKYNAKQQFILRNKPEVTISQLASNMQDVLPYFGESLVVSANLVGNVDSVHIIKPDGSYIFEKPVFQQGCTYNFLAEVYEGYRYNGNGALDKVPTSGATVKFTNNITTTDATSYSLELDSAGRGIYTFVGGDINIGSGVKTISARVEIGSNSSTATFPWVYPASIDSGKVYVIGSNNTGTDFVTGGPDRILSVLRDPPGSNSYAYLEKGVTVNQSNSYKGSVSNEGSIDETFGAKNAVLTLVGGVGAGTITTTSEAESGTTIGVKHSEEYTGVNTSRTSSTFTTRFQTSPSPEYVGANGDVYIGYSTNLSFGSTNVVSIVSKAEYNRNTNNGTEDYYDNVFYDEDDNWVLVEGDGTNISQNFSTLFAYSQQHILNRLIPNLEDLRNKLLMQISDYDSLGLDSLQAIANQLDTVFYLSYLPPTDPDFGKSNSDTSIVNKSYGTPNNNLDGPSYRVIYKNVIDNNYVNNLFKGKIIPIPDTINYLNQAISKWEQEIANNEKAKLEAELLQNYSVQAGVELEYSESYSGARVHNSSFDIAVGLYGSTDVSATAFAVTWDLHIEENIVTTQGGEFESEVERTHSKGFVLSEEGTDYLSVDVCREKNENNDYNNGQGFGGSVDEGNVDELDYYPSFVFRTKGGVTSCPHEVEEVTQFYNPGSLLSVATISMEDPLIYTDNDYVENVPSGETAKFTVYMTNQSEAKEAMWMNLKIDDKSNPNGAKIFMDGSPIGSGRKLIIPSGELLTKTIEVGKGAVLDYEDLQIILESECQPSDDTDLFEDIADTLVLQVHFIKSCSDVAIIQPYDNWVYNTKLDTMSVDGINQHYMNVQLGNFDVNYTDFDHIELQYKAASESDNQYKTLMSFYNDSSLYRQALANGLSAQMINSLDGGKINYKLFMDNLADQRYNLRAVTICNIGGDLVYNYSEVASGIKDMYNPRLFGSAQPADGILSVEDEIRLNFNEPIADGYLTKRNFQITGVRNGSTTDHNVSLVFDGSSDYLYTDAVRNLTDKSFTVEMWINADLQDAVLFSHGNVNQNIALKITADKHLVAVVNGTEYTSSATFNYDRGSWAHVAMVFKKEGKVALYYNYTEILSDAVCGAYSGIGNFIIGASLNNDQYFSGKLHNIRIWDEVRSMADLQLYSLSKLTGNEIGLMLYAPVNEGKGSVAQDLARGSNFAINGCEWSMPDGYATMFDGSTGYLKLNTEAASIPEDVDFTIEFWFKADASNANAVMLANGDAFGNNFGGSHDKFEIGFDANSILYFACNNHKVAVDGVYNDNNWHHIAVTGGRTQGRLQLYVDGNLKSYSSISNFTSIGATYAFVGARGWNEINASIYTMDKYFRGNIDEVRIWNLYKTASVVKEYMNKRLKGDEIGLIAYYPFEYYDEWQGNMDLNYTLVDQHELSDPTYVPAVAEANGQAVESMLAAPILDRGPAENLSFNYVVNNDALIITLDEPADLIEKTIVTLVADGILDQNGNEILSPIMWSAYINRNQLKWSQNEWTDTKKLYDEYEFTIDVINNGGSIINYEITNLPTWLTVSTQQNSINPLSVNHITFTVSKDLNVGTYSEVVYLTNENNVSEPLYINLTVVGEVPDWSVNPADFKYNMSIFGKMRFNNIFSDDKNDILAAFNGSQCVGVANCSYNKDVDMWFTMLTVYGNLPQDKKLSFRMYDASTGITYEAIPAQEITFRNNAIYGTPLNPIVFDGMTILYQDININSGWNWVSFNLNTDALTNINTALSSAKWHSGDIIKNMVYFSDYSAKKGGWQNAFWSLDNVGMFMIYAKEPTVINLSGVVMDPSTCPIRLSARRWNYISYLPNKMLSVKVALAGYEAKEGDVVKSIDKFAMYSGNNWIGSLEYMEPTAGYMLLNTDKVDKTLYYPSTSTTSSYAPAVNSSEYSSNMSVIAIANNVDAGDVIEVYAGDVLRGTSVAVNYSRNTTLQFISVAGETDEEQITFVLRKADGTTLTSTTHIMYEPNAVKGTIEAPVIIEFENAEIITLEPELSLYPNPAKSFVEVTLNGVDAQEAEVIITNAAGNQVFVNSNAEVVDGKLQLNITLDGLAAGNYMVTVNVNGEVYSAKFIKL